MDIAKTRIQELFEKVTSSIFGRPVNFAPLEEELGKLKKGGKLTLSHLEHIADPKIWPFSQWYLWPPGEYLEKILHKTDGVFKTLGRKQNFISFHDKFDEEYEEEEKKIFDVLFNIFKHIELVSIILRFIDSDNYGIYSPPVACYLNTPRGYTYDEEFLNYTRELRNYGSIYKIEKVAYVDMFMWALSMTEKPCLKNLREEIWDYFHKDIQMKRKKRNSKQLLGEIIGKPSLMQAKSYYELEAYDTATKWAGVAFLSTLKEKCKKYHINRKFYQGSCKVHKPNSEIIEELCNRLGKKPEKLKRVLQLRNLSAHESYNFSKEDVDFMITTIEEFQKW